MFVTYYRKRPNPTSIRGIWFLPATHALDIPDEEYKALLADPAFKSECELGFLELIETGDKISPDAATALSETASLKELDAIAPAASGEAKMIIDSARKERKKAVAAKREAQGI